MSRNRKTLTLLAAAFGALTLLGIVALIAGHPTIAGVIGLLLLGATGLLVGACVLLLRSATVRLLNEISRGGRRESRDRRKVAKGIDRLTRETHRARAEVANTREEVNRAEFRIKAHVDAAETRGEAAVPTEFRDELIAELVTELATREALAQDYNPVAAIMPTSARPTTLRSLAHAVTRLDARNILAINLGESALWLAYANRQARLVILSPTESAVELRRAVNAHGISDRVQILAAAVSSVDVPHHYEPWFALPEEAGPFDTIVLGACGLSTYPAPFVLKKFSSASASLVLPPDRDPQVVSAWTESGQVKPTDDPQVLSFHG